ncbi:MAG: glycosyltransferase family 4 protein [Thalassobaculales bacterium]
MRVAFYAPMKPPDHPVPSGDRSVARRLMQALAGAGHRVELASRFQSRDGGGDRERQELLRQMGQRLADKLIGRLRAAPPDAWLTYHCHHKAPDWLGPRVAGALAIPYLIVEASHAAKRDGGPWAIGQRGAAAAILAADAHLLLNASDREGLLRLGVEAGRLVPLRPFLDPAPYLAAPRGANAVPLLLAVGMFRNGDKLASYRALGRALALLQDRPWRLAVVGDGPARPAVEAALAPLGGRVDWRGALPAEALPGVYAEADLMVWPAVGEAIGMALLEAAAAGTPAVSVAARGVPDVVADQVTGLLVPPEDDAAFAAAVASLLDDPGRRQALAAACRPHVAAHHGLDAAAGVLDATLRRLVAR